MSARGWCKMHYQRWYKHGDPNICLQQHYSSPEESFATRTEWQGDCLVWVGSTVDGYGMMHVNRVKVSSHRWIWEKKKGPIHEGEQIDHICWNRACVNTDHMRIVSHTQNQQYMSGARTDNNSSGRRNVHKSGNNWKVDIQCNNKRHVFGPYQTIDEAAAVAEKARLELFGEFAGKG